MVVFLLLLSFLVVPVSAADVYDVSDDASPVPFAAAQWSTADSLHLQQIADRLNSSSGSAASLLVTISSKIGSNPNSIFYYLSTMDNRISNMYNAMVGTGYVGGVSMGEGLFGHLRHMTNNYLSPISSNMSATYTQVKAIADKMDSSGQSLRDLLVAPAGWEFVDHGGFRRVLDRPISLIELLDNWSLGMWERDTTPADWLWLSFTGEVGQIGRRVSTLELLDNGFLGLASRMAQYSTVNSRWLLNGNGEFDGSGRSATLAEISADGFSGLARRMDMYFLSSGIRFLDNDGSENVSGVQVTPISTLANGFLGLANRLSGNDRATTFSFLPKDVTQAAVSVSVDNLLDAIGVVGTELQNPLQRLAFVFASDQDLSIRDDVSDNVDSAQDNFFKPGSGGSVSPDNIGDAAGLSSGFKDSLSSPVSVGDFFTQFNSDSNYSYFSEQSRADLDTVSSPVAISDIDSFVDDVLALDSDGDGYVSLYDPDSLLDFLKKGG